MSVDALHANGRYYNEVRNHNPKRMRIAWVMGNYCNYSCSYCWPSTHQGDVPMPKWSDDYMNNLKHLMWQYTMHGSNEFEWILTGGEPTQYSDIKKLVEIIRALPGVHKIICQTNASRTLRWWRQNVHLFDGLYITIHAEESDIDHIWQVAQIAMDSADLTKEKNYQIKMHIAGHPTMQERVKQFGNRLLELRRQTLGNDFDANTWRCRINASIKWLDTGRDDGQDYELFGYSKEYADWIRWFNQYWKDEYIDTNPHLGFYHSIWKNQKDTSVRYVDSSIGNFTKADIGHFIKAEDLVETNPDYTGWHCFAHKQWLEIDKYGSLRLNCHQNLTPHEPHKNKFGNYYNIFEPHADFKKFRIPRGPLVCGMGACKCLGLYEVSKINTNSKQKEVLQ